MPPQERDQASSANDAQRVALGKQAQELDHMKVRVNTLQLRYDAAVEHGKKLSRCMGEQREKVHMCLCDKEAAVHTLVSQLE